MEKLLGNVEHLIGGILLGNNFVNILAASITTILALKLWGEGSVIVASLILTLVILIFAETAPKTYAANNPEKVALPAALVLEFIIKIFKPIIWLISNTSQIILKPFGLIKNTKDKLSSEELRMAVIDSKSMIARNYQKCFLISLI